MTPYERPLHHLRAIHSQYPRAWIDVETFRRQRRELGDWPAWCYMPLAGAYAIVSGGGDARVPLEEMPAVGVLGAMAAWRETQGIYEYDETILSALWETPLEGDLPVEILQRLPDWCVYVMLPPRRLLGVEVHGFFAHLESDASTGRQELRFAVDAGQEPRLLIPMPLHLGTGTVEQAIDAALAEARRQVELHPELQPVAAAMPGGSETVAEHVTALGHLTSLLLYLCSESSEIVERAIERAAVVHPRRPPKAYPKAPTTWDVGHRLGAALRHAEAAERDAAPAGGHARPRPHVRRAHWHTYLTGPREGSQRRELRWLPPIPVNVDLGAIVPVVRRVE